MRKLLSIRTRLLLSFALVSILAAGISAYVGFHSARQSLQEVVFNKLTTVREIQARQVEDYFQQIRHQVVTLSENRMIIEAMKEFNTYFFSFNQDMRPTSEQVTRHERELRLYYEKEFLPRLSANSLIKPSMYSYWSSNANTRMLQSLYIALNPFDTGSKHQLNAADDGSNYSNIHKRYHPLIRNYLERFGYYDIFLVDNKTGNVVYSVAKEVDFGTSMHSGPYSKTNFADAFRAAQNTENCDFVYLADFEPYHPSYNGQASFIASPICDDTGMQVGVLVFQMPVDRINSIMTNQQQWNDIGLGSSGETYIVGDDLKLRTEPRFLIEDPEEYLEQLNNTGVPPATIQRIKSLNSAIGLQEVNTEGSIDALKGRHDTKLFNDYRGLPVLSSYRPLRIEGVNWAILSEIDQAEAFIAATKLRDRMLLWFFILLIGSLLLALLFSRSLVNPLRQLARNAQQLAAGELDNRIEAPHHDEIGDLAQSFDTMRVSIKELVEGQAAMIDALSTPLIPLGEDVVVLPLVGEFDERRNRQFNEALTTGIHKAGARAAIVDITGVPNYNEVFAHGLAQAAAATRLLGAELIITGARPDMAKGLAELENVLATVSARRSLQDGIDYAVARIGTVQNDK